MARADARRRLAAHAAGERQLSALGAARIHRGQPFARAAGSAGRGGAHDPAAPRADRCRYRPWRQLRGGVYARSDARAGRSLLPGAENFFGGEAACGSDRAVHERVVLALSESIRTAGLRSTLGALAAE